MNGNLPADANKWLGTMSCVHGTCTTQLKYMIIVDPYSMHECCSYNGTFFSVLHS